MSRYQLMSVPELCGEAASLLAANGREDWAGSFSNWADQFRADRDQTARAIFSASRGWSEIVLHKGGDPLVGENDALQAILDELTRLATASLNSVSRS